MFPNIHGPGTNTTSNHRRCTCAPRWHHKGTRLPDRRSSPGSRVHLASWLALLEDRPVRCFLVARLHHWEDGRETKRETLPTECHEKPLPQMPAYYPHTYILYNIYIYKYIYILIYNIYNIIIYILHINDVRAPARVRNSSRCQIHRRESWCSSASESSRIGTPICMKGQDEAKSQWDLMFLWYLNIYIYTYYIIFV